MKAIYMLALAALLSCAAQGPQVWPNGTIPFVLLGMNSDEMNKVFESMYLWEAASIGRIQFRPANPVGHSETGILYIVKNEIISGALGTGYYPDDINILFLDRFEQRAILHELGHKIGLEHEHQRPDRDLFITIDWGRVNPELVSQFAYRSPDLYDYAGYSYDYISVMHYGPEETTAIDSHGHPIGSDNISFTDALKVQDLYEKSE